MRRVRVAKEQLYSEERKSIRNQESRDGRAKMLGETEKQCREN
jgi:hypothetical protein